MRAWAPFRRAYGEVGDEAKAKSERRRGRSRRGSTAFRQPPGVASRVGGAPRRPPEPLGLRGWHATATANNILTHEPLYRLGLAIYLIEIACQIAMTVHQVSVTHYIITPPASCLLTA